MGKIRELFSSVRQIIILLICVLVVFFAFLNTQPTSVDLGFVQLDAPISLLILIPLLTGLVLGWVGGGIRSRRKRRAREVALQEEEAALAAEMEVEEITRVEADAET